MTSNGAPELVNINTYFIIRASHVESLIDAYRRTAYVYGPLTHNIPNLIVIIIGTRIRLL